MARYIDADKIPYTMLYKENWMGRTGIEKRGVWKDTIDAMPTADVEEVRHGKWIPHPTEREWDVCSACGTGCKRREYGADMGHEWVTEYGYLYCPNCGAMMYDLRGDGAYALDPMIKRLVDSDARMEE